MAIKAGSQEIVRELFGLPIEVFAMQENVLDDFSCAWKQLVKIYGRLFCTDLNLCFYSHFLGYKTKLVIPFKEVTSIKKEKAVFSQGIDVNCTNSKHYVFGGFQESRETFKFIYDIWKSQYKFEVEDLGCEGNVGWSGDEYMIDQEREEGTLILEDQDPLKEVKKVVVSLSPGEFFDHFLSNSAQFSFKEFWLQCGYTEVHCDPWVLYSAPNAFNRTARYRMQIKSGLFAPDSTRMDQVHQCVLETDKLLLRIDARPMDSPYYTYYHIEQEWIVTEISDHRSLLRCSVAIKFDKGTTMKKPIRNNALDEVKSDLDAWEQEFLSRKLIPGVLTPSHETENQHKFVKYEEVDLKKVKEAQGYVQTGSTLLVLGNILGIVCAGLYLLYLHCKLTDSVPEINCI